MGKFSFIIPAYNCEKFIGECLDSIIFNKKNWQYISDIIVINDGSSDKTAEIIQKYVNKCNLIKYIFQENSGAPIARNKGIENATGEYIIFLDSDDLLNNNFFENIDKVCIDNYDLILGNYITINKKGEEINHNNEYIEEKIITGEDIFKLSSNDPKPGSKIYNTNIIKKNNLIFDNLKIGQDTNFFIKYLLFCKKVYALPYYVYKYRLVDGSISHTYTLKNLKIIDTFNVIKKFYINNDAFEIYDKFIKYAEAQHYYFQFCKLRKYEDYNDRKIIYYTFKKEYKNLNLKKENCLSQKNLNYLRKFDFRLSIGLFFTSKLNYTLSKMKGVK